MARLHHLGWYVVQGKSIVYSKEFYEDNLIKEKHSGGMARNFGRDKTISIIREHYFWPQLSRDVKKFVQSCQVFEVAKGFIHNTRLY